MTKILVLSDSHGAYYKLEEIFEKECDASVAFFLGDGERDIDRVAEKFPHIYVHKLCGNCDFGSALPASVIDEIEGYRFYATHGHFEYVKHGLGELLRVAKAQAAAVALYGHTHNPDTHYEDGVLFFNPGSVKMGQYGVIDAAKNGILPVLRNLR